MLKTSATAKTTWMNIHIYKTKQLGNEIKSSAEVKDFIKP